MDQDNYGVVASSAGTETQRVRQVGTAGGVWGASGWGMRGYVIGYRNYWPWGDAGSSDELYLIL